MSRLTIVIAYATLVLVSYLAISCDAHNIQVGDLEVAASGKQKKWEKGNEADHHESKHGAHGKKGEEGYDKKSGYVF